MPNDVVFFSALCFLLQRLCLLGAKATYSDILVQRPKRSCVLKQASAVSCNANKRFHGTCRYAVLYIVGDVACSFAAVKSVSTFVPHAQHAPRCMHDA